MGFLSRLKSDIKKAASITWSAAKKVGKTVKEAVTKPIETAKKASKAVKNTAQKSWVAVTGKNAADEAKEIFDRAKSSFDREQEKLTPQIDKMVKSIETQVHTINALKKKIYEESFSSFKTVANHIKNISVKSLPFEQLFDGTELAFNSDQTIKSRRDVILIDFDNLSISEVTKSVLTLGYFSRKKANESKTRALEQQKAMEQEIAKMQAHLVQLNVLNKALDNVVMYFEELIENYSNLLDRFEYGVNTQRSLQLSQGVGVSDLRLDFKKMPIVHIQEFQALFNLSIVLKTMASLSYISSSEAKVIDQDIDSAKNLKKMGEMTVHQAA